MLDPASPAFRIGDLATLWLTVHAFERDAVRIRNGVAAATVVSRASRTGLHGHRDGASGAQVESESRTIPVRIDVRNRGGCFGPACRPRRPLPVGARRARRSWRFPSPRCSASGTSGACSCRRTPSHFEIRRIGRGRDLGGEVEVLSGLRAGETDRRRRRVPAQGAGRKGRGRSRCALRSAMISRLIRSSFRAPLLTVLLVGGGHGDRRVLDAGPPPRRVPGPLRAGLQRDRAERGDGRRGARDRRRHSAGGRARRPAGRPPGSLELTARRRAGHDRVRAATPTTTGRASSSPSASPRRPGSCRRAPIRR